MPSLMLIAVVAAPGAAAMLFVWFRYGKPEPSILVNGLLAGLVAITASCAFVSTISAVIVGAIAGVLVVASAVFIEQVLKVDDPVCAISVRGTCGVWGILALRLSADGTYGNGLNGVPGPVRGLLYGDFGQLAAQGIGALTCIVFVFGSFYVFSKLMDLWIGNRVLADVEFEGLDMSEMGAVGCPDFALASDMRSADPPTAKPLFRGVWHPPVRLNRRVPSL
jgi:Amt family ammonium transporter